MSDRRRASRRGAPVCALALALLLNLLFSSTAGAKPGDLDLSFGQEGHTIVQVNRACLRVCVEFGGSYADALALQPDGGIVLGGSNSYIGSSGKSTDAPGALVRLRPDGTLDSSFGGAGGVIDTPFAVTEIHANVLGGLRVAGEGEMGVGTQHYTSSGMLDGSYGTNGVRWLPGLDGGRRDGSGRTLKFVTVMVPATDYEEATTQFEVTRLLQSGRRDTHFGHHGYVTLPKWSDPVALDPQRDGSVLLVLDTNRREFPSKPSNLVLERLTATGKLDRTFGRQGVASVPADYPDSPTTII